MDRDAPRSGRAYLIEAVLIVGSILLAFAIDAAWEGRAVRQEEQDLLASLETDFRQNRDLLEQTMAVHGTHRRAAQEFLGARSAGTGAELGDATLIALVSWTTYDPVLGSLTSAIASGKLSLVRDPALRAELARWTDLVADMNETEEADRGHAERFADLAFDYVPFRSVVHRLGSEAVGGPSPSVGNPGGLLQSLRAENIAANRVAEIGFIGDDATRVRESLEAILALIEAGRGRSTP